LGSDAAQAVIQTDDGGFAVAGSTISFGAGLSDVWLIKTDSDGNMLWNKTYGDVYNDCAFSLVATSDGGYALAGFTYFFAAGGYDFYLVRTDSDGNMLWNQTYGGPDIDMGYSLVGTSDGGFAIAGETDSFGAGLSDFWLVRTDSDGNMLWNKTYGGTENDRGWSVVLTNDGGYAIAGSTESFGAGKEDVWLVKTDAAGNMQWDQTYGDTETDNAFSLIATGDGGFAVTGSTNSFGNGDYDVWLVKIDYDGYMLWNKTYGGPDQEYGWSVVDAGDDCYVIAGSTDSFGAGGRDVWLVRTYPNGFSCQTYGGLEWDAARAVIQTDDGGFVMAGYTFSFAADPGYLDVLLLKVGSVVVPDFLGWLFLPFLACGTLLAFTLGKRRKKHLSSSLD
jgi:hypothetical protein